MCIRDSPIDVSKYICIYGGAQKNLAPSGVTFVIVKNDALGKVSRYIPTMLNYQTHVDSGSMFNTPPVVPIYAALQTLRWIKAEGGVKEMERLSLIHISMSVSAYGMASTRSADGCNRTALYAYDLSLIHI